MTGSRPGPHHPTAVLPSPQGAPFRTTLGRTDMSGPTRTLRFIGTELHNRKRFVKRCGQWARGVPQLGGPACCRAGRAPGVGGSGHWTLLLLRSLDGLLASVVVFGCKRALQRRAGAIGVGAGQEQSQRGRRKRHFSLGWCSWSRPWPGWSGPPGSGSGSGAGLSQRPRWRWTGRHLAVLPGPGRGLRVGSAHG